MASYEDAKANVWRHQRADDVAGTNAVTVQGYSGNPTYAYAAADENKLLRVCAKVSNIDCVAIIRRLSASTGRATAGITVMGRGVRKAGHCSRAHRKRHPSGRGSLPAPNLFRIP